MKYRMIGLVALLGSCASVPEDKKAIGLPNPASAYCVDQGGRFEIRNGRDGQTGYCHLPDGRVVDEWELFRSGRPGT